MFRSMLWSCHLKGRLDDHAGQAHRGPLLAAMPHVFLPVLLPLPRFLQELRHQHLKMLTIDAVNSTHVHTILQVLYLCPDGDWTSCIPL